MIHITAQMRVLVAIEPVDGRKGIDSLLVFARKSSLKIQWTGCVLCSGVGEERRFGCSSYDGPGYWLAQKRPLQRQIYVVAESSSVAKQLEAYEAQFADGGRDVSRVRAAPMWRRVSALLK